VQYEKSRFKQVTTLEISNSEDSTATRKWIAGALKPQIF